MSIELKIQAKTLAVEAKIIRLEEHKAKAAKKTYMVNYLRAHRVGKVRSAARSVQLARAYLRGARYRDIEKTRKSAPDYTEILRLVDKYGPTQLRRLEKKERQDRLKRWFASDNLDG